MPLHPALTAGRAAVITGASSGIGLAAARRFASMGLKVCLADLSAEALERAAAEVVAVAPTGRTAVLAVPPDVSPLAQVQALGNERWRRLLEVNLWGVINGLQTFAPAMLAQVRPTPSAPRLGHRRHNLSHAELKHVDKLIMLASPSPMRSSSPSFTV